MWITLAHAETLTDSQFGQEERHTKKQGRRGPASRDGGSVDANGIAASLPYAFHRAGI